MSIPFAYLVGGSELATFLAERKDNVAADSVMTLVRQVARAVKVEHLMSSPNPPSVPRGDTSR